MAVADAVGLRCPPTDCRIRPRVAVCTPPRTLAATSRESNAAQAEKGPSHGYAWLLHPPDLSHLSTATGSGAGRFESIWHRVSISRIPY